MKLKDVCSLEAKVLINLDSILKSRDHHFTDKGPYSQSYGFSCSHVWTDYKESWEQNWCFWTVELEKTLESPLDCKEIPPVRPKGNQSWIFIGRTDAGAETPNTLATWCEELTHLKRPWCWERLKVGGERDDRGWDGWMASPIDESMASPTRWTWVWVSCGSWWWTGKPGRLQFMGSRRVRHDWVTEMNWTELKISLIHCQKQQNLHRVKILCVLPWRMILCQNLIF